MSEHQESKDEDIQDQESNDQDTQEELSANTQNRRWRWRPARRPGEESGEWEEEMSIIVPNINIALSILNALIADSPLQTEGSLRQTEGSLRQTEGSVRQTEGSVRQTEGSVRQTEGSVRQTEGSVRQTEGSLRQTPPYSPHSPPYSPPHTPLIPQIPPSTPLQTPLIPQTPPSTPLQTPLIPQITRVRQREEDETTIEQNKSLKVSRTKRIVKKRANRKRTSANQYSYLLLKSGNEFHFNKESGNNILLNNTLEPNRLIRNIISRVPTRLIDRLKYLVKFDSEEESDSESESDSNSDTDNSKKVEKRYFGNLKELVYAAYIKESRLRFLFKRVLALWRVHIMDKKCEIGLDPITLAEPIKKVYVYDWSNKKKFVFDAKSLATLIESRLMYQEYGFSMPQYPRNPNNNVDFTLEQLISIYYQLKEHGELRWGFTTLRAYDFKLNIWVMYHKSALTMNSIRKSISLLDTNEDRELFSDFISLKLEELNFRTNATIIGYYHTAMIKDPKHWYLEKLKAMAISYYEAEHFGYYVEAYINEECLKIFQKEAIFFKDLRTRKLI
jgi:hypothetical protein